MRWKMANKLMKWKKELSDWNLNLYGFLLFFHSCIHRCGRSTLRWYMRSVENTCQFVSQIGYLAYEMIPLELGSTSLLPIFPLNHLFMYFFFSLYEYHGLSFMFAAASNQMKWHSFVRACVRVFFSLLFITWDLASYVTIEIL